ncbi:DUF3159 domain-containing protein [Streptomyces capitiformicae]|uniref:DUF3159 domain-containing protein n=1 Tax=Streptomyces capitiformicae TaxID=2014920 RepID=UPI0038CD499E
MARYCLSKPASTNSAQVTRLVPLGWGVGCAATAGVVGAGARLRRGTSPWAALLGLSGVLVAVAVVLYTGRAADFFLVQIVSHALSATAWALSIAGRWPLLGAPSSAWSSAGAPPGDVPRRCTRLQPRLGRPVVPAPHRIAVFVPLWISGHVVALGAARVAFIRPSSPSL